MTLSYHATNKIWVRCCEIDFSLSIVVTCDEKRCVESILLENIEKLRSIVIGTIII